MSRYVYLSYTISETTPLYGGAKALSIARDKAIQNGDSSNTLKLSMPNHSGTHIDFPYHFGEHGKTLNDYPAEFWLFSRPYVLDCPAAEGETVLPVALDDIPEGTDFLIIRTGFYKRRAEDVYWHNNPGLSPELAGRLRQRCPHLRVVGMDLISVSGYQNRELGRVAHRAFLIEHDLLLVEDMDLSTLTSKIHTLVCLPLPLDRADGAPVTIIAEIDE